MRWEHGGWGAGQWFAMSLVMVLFWTLVVALVVWLVRSSRHPVGPTPKVQSSSRRAEEVLAERFARGELNEQEYVLRRDLLRSG